jgi:hypothetical protein
MLPICSRTSFSIQCFYLVASSILCHTPIRTNTSNVALDPSVTHLTSFYAHTCVTTVRSLHLQLANKPCPDQRFRTRRAGPPSIAHIWERPTDGIMLYQGNPHQDTRAHREGENGPTRRQIIQMSSFIDIAAPPNPFLSGNALDKAPSPRPTSESPHLRTRRNLMLCLISISRRVYRSRLTFRMVHCGFLYSKGLYR